MNYFLKYLTCTKEGTDKKGIVLTGLHSIDVCTRKT